MPTNSEPFDITDDSELKAAIRNETGYDTGKIDDLSGIIDSAKRELALRADLTNFYADRGSATALFGIGCVKAKSNVENKVVQTKNLGPDDVSFRTTDGSSLQVKQYEQMVQLGLSSAENTDVGTTSIRFTNTHLNGDLD